jgi:hypothetical protein
MLWKYSDIREEALRDSRFRRKWEIEKMIRMQEQKGCAYCGVRFGRGVRAVLHHRKMAEKVSIVIDVKQLLNYYKSLKDTDLICDSCHAFQHLVSKRAYQTKLKRWFLRQWKG